MQPLFHTTNGSPDMHRFIFFTMLMASIAQSHRAHGHGGGVLLQAQNGGLAVGLDNEDGGTQDMGVRVFAAQFPSLYAINAPSFISLSSPPTGYEVIPPQTNVSWDFLPMNYGGMTSNLLYWDGQGTTPSDVSFGLPTDPNVTLTLFGRNNIPASVGADSTMIPGPVLDQTLAAGNLLRLHGHRYFFLDDNDGSTSTPPADGIYLLAMHLRMDDFGATEPFYILFSTLDITLTALDNAAMPWVEERQSSLVLAGDYNFDGVVDESDYAAWQNQFSSSGPFPIAAAYADGTRNGTVNAADFVFWRDRLGASAVGLRGPITVPEPPMLTLVVLAAMLVLSRMRCDRSQSFNSESLP